MSSRANRGKRHGARSRGHKTRIYTKQTLVLLILCVLAGTGIAAYNMDSVYLAGKHNIMTYIPDKLIGGGDNVLLLRASDMTNNPVSGTTVDIKLETNGTIYNLYTGKTDATGTIQPSFRVPRLNQPAVIIITAAGETIKRNVSIDSTARILISTDKPLYQPGQVIHIRTLAFEGTVPMAQEKPVIIEIQTPEGDKIFRKSLNSNEFGIASMDYPLSDQLPLGAYKIKATRGECASEKSVLVKRYVLPKFQVELEGVRSWYTVNDDVNGNLSCRYMFGKPVSGRVKMDARVYFGVTWNTVGSAEGSLADGVFPFHLPHIGYSVGVPINDNNGYLELNVTVTDSAGHQEIKSYIITIGFKPILITALSDTNVMDMDSKYYIIAQFPDGAPVADAELTVDLNYTHSDTKTIYTDSRGIAELTFKYTGQAYMLVTARKGDITASETFSITGYSYGLKLVSDKAYYKVGDVAKVTVRYRGDTLTNWVYYDVVSKGFVVCTGRLQIRDGMGEFSLPISPDMSELTTIRAYKTQSNLDVVKDSLLIGVGTTDDMTVTVTPDMSVYTPTDDVNLKFSVKEKGKGVNSAIGVSIVDKAVFEANERFTGFEEVYFGLEKDFMTPSYMICSYVFSNSSSYDLPTSSLKQVGKENIVGEFIEMGWQNKVAAENAKTDAVGKYWSVIFSIGILCVLGLFILAFKYRKAGVALVIILLILLPFITAAALYTMTIGFSGSGTGGFSGNDDSQRHGFDNGINEQTKGGGMGPVPAPPPSSSQSTDRVTPSNPSTAKPTHIRTFFPETWYWNPTLITDENGEASVGLVAPDSITTWDVDAFASTKEAKFGRGNANITVFQKFFIEPDIPVSAVRGDVFPLKILVYNYEDKTKNITVTLFNDTWFSLLSNASSKTIEVPQDSAGSVDFVINATSVGVHQVNVTAASDTLADAVVRDIRIAPDGKSLPTTINGELDNNQTDIHEIALSDTRVPGSENAYIKLQGGMEAVTLDGAENYIQFVSGCGEQSMSTLSVDILAYATVLKMNGTDEQSFKYENIVNQGIQHELTFLLDAKNGIGRGIVWFPEDQDVHPWLTSWGLITFKDAVNAGFTIDDNIIKDMQKWLVSQQKGDGSFEFPEWGIYETANQILRSKKIASTAYIARALLYSGYDPLDNAIGKAANYIEQNIRDHWTDAYTLALSLITLEMSNGVSALRDDIAAQLVKLGKADNDTVYWDSETNLVSDSDMGFSRWGATSKTIETTGYAIMALNKHGGNKDIVRKGVRYLLSHRSEMGGFFATQDTVVAFQALSSVGNIRVDDISVEVFADGKQVSQTRLTKENSDITYLVDLRKYLNLTANKTKILIKSNGSGTVIYQIYYEEYIPWAISGIEKPKELILDITYDVTNISVNDCINAHLHLKYVGSAEMIKMLLLDLRAPVGFSFVEEEWQSMLSAKIISQYELKDRQLLVYLDDVKKDVLLELNYSLKANMPIKGSIQGVCVWDMYNPALRTETAPVEVIAR